MDLTLTSLYCVSMYMTTFSANKSGGAHPVTLESDRLTYKIQVKILVVPLLLANI